MKQEETKLTPAERWERATLANNFIFCKVMTENKELCKQLLEILLHIKIDHIESPLAEKNVKVDFDSHGIRFDVYTKDDDRVFDIEVQTTDKPNLPERARYYQSLIDSDNLLSGEDYSEIKESYIIFLCLGDIFKKGMPVYSFENICTEDTSIKLGDRAYKIFFNAQQCDIMPTDEEQAFFRFLQGETAETDFTRRLAIEVTRAKHNAQWRMQFMTWEQSIKEEAQIRAKVMAKDMAKDMAQDMAQDMAKDMAQDMAKDMAQDMAKDMAQDMAKDMAQDMAKDMAQDIAKNIAQDIAKERFLEVAKRMLETHMGTVEAIASVTQLPVEEIQALAVSR